jgi:predicted DCC family thiol-disulfide oxidoreductase YuxK
VTSPSDTDLHAHAIVIFDGLCHFCDRTVQFILSRDRRGYFRFAPSQSDIARALLTRSGLSEAPGTIVLIDADGCWTRSTASLRIARALGFPWSIFAMLLWLPSVVRDPVYALVARNRLRWFGRRDACRIPTPEQASRFIS